MPEPLILDAFTLFGPVPPRGAAQPGTDVLTEQMKKHGVAGAITASTRGLFYSAPAGNRETAALCREADGVLQPAAVLDPRLPLASQASTGARLLCLMPATQRLPLPFSPLNDLLRALAQAGTKVPIFCEASRVGDATRLREAIDAANLTAPAILLGSVSGDSLIEAISVARSSDRFRIVTNGMLGVGEVNMAVAALGASRVVFGSSAPVRSLGAALAVVRRAGLSPGDLEQILGANTKQLIASGGVAA